MDTAVDAQEHRADLWQLYLNLELQAQKQEDFRYPAGDLYVQLRGALICQRQYSEYEILTKCAGTSWGTDRAYSKDTTSQQGLVRSDDTRRFFTYLDAGDEYSDVEWDAATSFSVHRGFELVEEETLSVHLQRSCSSPDDGADGARLPAHLTMKSGEEHVKINETSIGDVKLSVHTRVTCFTTLEVEAFEVCGVAATGTDALSSRNCLATASCPCQVACTMECSAAGAIKPHSHQTLWADLLPTGRVSLGSAATFFLPEKSQTKNSVHKYGKHSAPGAEGKEEMQEESVNMDEVALRERNRQIYVLKHGASADT